MNAKEYLSQARNLDQRIITKNQMIDSLNDLATRCTATYSDMPKSPNRGNSRLEECVMKIIDLEEQITEDMEKLVNLKKELMQSSPFPILNIRIFWQSATSAVNPGKRSPWI